MSNKGFFVISLDLELYWGMFDKVTLEAYGDNIRGEQQAIPEILALFAENGIHATWASVGMLLCENKDELFACTPAKNEQPIYPDMRISSYEHMSSVGNNEHDDPYHFGAHLMRQILDTPHQELGSHTFSHYYCIDGENNAPSVFTADCEAFKKSAAKFDTGVVSIVFPRNQTTEEALRICKEQGFSAYRGTPDHYLYTGKREKDQTNPFLRIMRLIDAYINISGHHTQKLSEVQEEVLPNVRGSRFLRPYSRRLRALEKLRIARIKDSMTYAAKHGEIFHLWWHPHNFGINRKENLQNLTEIIEHYHALTEHYGMESATMREIALYARSNEAPQTPGQA